MAARQQLLAITNNSYGWLLNISYGYNSYGY